MNVILKGAFLVLLLLASGCSEKPVEGLYVFRSNQVNETLDLRPGGEFTQRVEMGGANYSGTGQWSLASRDLKLRGRFFVRFDTRTGKLLQPPQEYSFYSGYWDARNNRISFSPDYDAQFFVKRAP